VRGEAEHKGESEARGLGARRCRGAAGGISVDVANRSGVDVEAEAAAELARHLLIREGIQDAELGIAFVSAEESRALKRDHLGVDEATDVLSFPIDGRDPLPSEVPRQLGDVVLCPAVVGDAWRRPLAHGLLHLLGYEHGPEMEEREEVYAA
jgi:probable rRNA maturation factor